MRPLAIPAGHLLGAFLLLPSACGSGDSAGDSPAGADSGAGGGDDLADAGPVASDECEGAEIESTAIDYPLSAGSSFAITAAGVPILAATEEDDDGSDRHDIVVSERGTQGWSYREVVTLDLERDHTHPALVTVGEIVHLFWSASRPDAPEVRDIFHAIRTDGVWSEPVSLTSAENIDGRTSTAVRALAVGPAEQLAVIYGSFDPSDAFGGEQVRMLYLVEGVAAFPAAVAHQSEGGCDAASAIHDTNSEVHVVALCHGSNEYSDQIRYAFGNSIFYEPQVMSRAVAFQEGRPSLARGPDGRLHAVWDTADSCPDDGPRTCGHLQYAMSRVGFEFEPAVDGVYWMPERSEWGEASPSLAVDGSGRVSIAFHRSGGGGAGDVFVMRSEASAGSPADPPTLDPPAFADPCRLAGGPDRNELFPTAVIDPATGELHILYSDVDWERGSARLLHARLP